MASIGIILKNGLNFTKKLPATRKDPWQSQLKVLTRLLNRAEYTIFGQEYHFSKIIRSHDRVKAFQEEVPVHNYESILKWWRMSLEGEDSVCWPGKVEYFALSSGTSTGSTKYIPVTRAMMRAIQKASIKQILSLAYCNLPEDFYEKNILMLGGSTHLDYNGIYYAGDLSGITTGHLPFWFQPFYRPGREISKTKNWQDKLDFITKEAHKWDVGAIVGVPAWFQLLMERIIEYHKVDNIHDIWPNLMVYTHGGVAFEPYKKGFEALLGKPLIYLETYLASEGFIAYQARPEAEGMRLLVRNGIFFEFVPFSEKNIDGDGNILSGAEVLTLNQVQEGKDYALLLSTCAGAWRYAIGDVVRFTSVEDHEIRITGRTKHYLSLVGEHLSVENMNKAIEMIQETMNISIKEFTVAGVSYQNLFAHHWYVSVEEEVNKEALKEKLDFFLKELNDDYRVERQHALKEVILDVVPNEAFLGWLKSQGKEGAQVKFPRVLKKEQIASWENYLTSQGIPVTLYV
jgi:hypothetical protein